jgi:hypothetical protein
MTQFSFNKISRALRAGLLIAAFSAIAQPAHALLWNWNYTGPGFTGTGMLTTVDTPDGVGFYQVTGITGTRNGVAITGLFPTGASIPGNEPFNLDNLIKQASPQLTTHGLGFSLADGNYVNVYYADFLSTPVYTEVFSAPPFVPGSANFGPEDHELPISSFSASLASGSVPEPSTLALLVAGWGFGVMRRRRTVA